MQESSGHATPILFVFGGLPGSGKSELAKALARQRRAVYLRIDTIEQALRESQIAVNGPEGYIVAYRLAGDNLRLGLDVVADSVNPIAITRSAWQAVARQAGVACCEIEIVCSDPSEHRRRVEARESEVPGLLLPTWQQVVERHYERWDSADLVVDTAGQTVAESKETLLQRLRESGVTTSS